jgi:F-type H+-transporting ATPase subunit a
MEPEQLNWLAVLLNRLCGRPVAELLRLLHVPGVNYNHPISNAFAMELVAFLVGVIFFLWVKRHLSVERPGAVQQCVEGLLTNGWGVGVRDMLEDIVGHEGLQYTPIVGTIGIFILLSNGLGLVPGFEAPTAVPYVPLGCAAIVFLHHNGEGIRKHGAWGYMRRLAGPMVWVGPIVLVAELFSTLARLLSLTARLFANMMAGEKMYGIFLGLTLALAFFLGRLNPAGYATGVLAIVAPVTVLLLHILEVVLQAFIFTILPVLYLYLATGEEH